MSPQEKLLKLKNLLLKAKNIKGNVFLAKELLEIEEKLNEVSQETTKPIESIKEQVYSELESKLTTAINDFLSKIEVKDGHTPTQEELLELIKPLIEKPKNGIDGVDGYTPVKGEDYFTLEEIKEIQEQVKSQIELPEEITGEKIVEKINELPLDDDKKIDAKHIKNLPETVVYRGGGVSGIKEVVAGTGISVDNSNLGYPVVSSTAGVSDGDKGDITVSGSGATWVIDNLAVTDAKINDVAWGKITGTPTTLAGYGITDALDGSGTSNQIAYFTDSNTLASLSTATYPSLTELSYVKGLTSSAQTQLTDKANLAGGNTFTGTQTLNSDAVINGLTIGKGASSLAFNTALGVSALAGVTTGNYNIAIGSGSMQTNTIGDSNVAIGSGSLASNLSGANNVAIGRNALNSNTGSSNFALGSFAMASNTTGSDNVMIGYLSGQSNDTGSYNVGIGQQALRTGASKSYNVGLGYFALSASNGNNNVGIGAFAGSSISSGTNNTILGYAAGSTISTNSGMIALGHQAGRYETGSDKLFINNFNTGSEANDRSQSIIYGVMSSTTANQTLALNAQVTATYGLTTTKVLASSNDSGALGASGTAFSDLFLASGGVINWNAGNATLTHSAGLLTSNVSLSLGTSNVLTTGTIELGNASDTTLSRSSAGIVAVEGVPLGRATLGDSTFSSGVYSPSSSNLTNVSTLTVNNSQWMQVGNTVTVSGVFLAKLDSASTTTSFEIDLPVAVDIENSYELAGVFASGEVESMSGAIKGEVTNNTAYFQWIATNTDDHEWSFTFTYKV